MHDVILNARNFCYISVVLTEHLFGNLHVFHSFKVPYVSTLIIVKEENDPFLQEYSITWKNKFLLIFKNSNAAAGYPSYP